LPIHEAIKRGNRKVKQSEPRAAFDDGFLVFCVLDAEGARPLRFFCAKDGHPSIVLGSEIKGWAPAHFIGKLIELEEEGVAR